MKHSIKQQSNDPSDQQESIPINTDNSPKYIPVAKLPPKLITKKIIINISHTQYPIVSQVADELGWISDQKQGVGNWDVWWTDREVDVDVLYRMNLHQKINHYPGMLMLARKNILAMQLMSMKQSFIKQYDFFPSTWVIPQQFSEFRHYYQSAPKSNTYIVKPQALSQGRGIFLTKNIDDITDGNKYVIQNYISNPFLIEGLKFDLRIYVLMAGTNPLRLYIYEEGLTRLATEKYQQPTRKNLSNSYIHLTNYSFNKNNPNYIYNTSLKAMNIGHKRTLTSTYHYLHKLGYDVNTLKMQIDDVIIKTVISGAPFITYQYSYCQPQQHEGNMCFHILGFDVMLNSQLKPIVIEVNHTPSFQTSTPLDYYVKKKLIKDAFVLMRINQKNKKKLFEKAKNIVKKRVQNGSRQNINSSTIKQELQKIQLERDQAELECNGGYRKIHPHQNPQRQSQYNLFYQYAEKIYKHSRSFKKLANKQLNVTQTKKNRLQTSCQIKQQTQGIKKNIFRAKTSKNYALSSLNKQSIKKLNLKIANFINSKDIKSQYQKTQIMSDEQYYKQIKKKLAAKKLNFSTQHRQGIYIIPKNYDITQKSPISEIKSFQKRKKISNFKKDSKQQFFLRKYVMQKKIDLL